MAAPRFSSESGSEPDPWSSLVSGRGSSPGALDLLFAPGRRQGGLSVLPRFREEGASTAVSVLKFPEHYRCGHRQRTGMEGRSRARSTGSRYRR